MPGYKQAKLSALNRLRSLQNKKTASQRLSNRQPPPSLRTPTTVDDLQRAMEVIEREIDTHLRQTSCISYDQAKIDSLFTKINHLKGKYNALKSKRNCLLKMIPQEGVSTTTISSAPHSTTVLDRTNAFLSHPLSMTCLPLLECSSSTESPIKSLSLLAISVTALVVIIALIWKFLPITSVRVDVPQNYHVLITGGSSGIGLSLAQCFRSGGARLTLVARDVDKLDRAKQKLLQSDGGDVHTLSLDLCEKYEHLKHSLDQHVAQYGPVDILINCAGYAVARTFLDTPPSALDKLIRTNYLSAVHVTKILLPHMLSDQMRPSVDRRIAFVCSMAGQIGVYGLAAYTASKYAIRGFAEVLSMELENSGPFVTLSFPPDTDTPGLTAENVGKPAATLEISSKGGLASPEHVAKTLYADIMAGKFISSFGLEGKALSIATAGLLPPLSAHSQMREGIPAMLFNSVVEVLLAGPLRAFGICYALFMRSIVRKHEKISD